MTKKTRRAKARRALLSISLVLVMMMVAVGGTIAWLTDSTEEIKNTFTVGEIDIDLTETPNYDSDNDETKDSWTADLIPGNKYEKDPKVTVIADSEECYLFVEVTEANNTFTIDGSEEKYLKYTLAITPTGANGWEKGKGGEGKIPANVYYRTVTSSSKDQSWSLLSVIAGTQDKMIEINDKLTNQTMPEQKDAPTLSFKAYAAQTANMTPEEAWVRAQTAAEWDTGANKTGFGVVTSSPTTNP